jgi:hypothetical protein
MALFYVAFEVKLHIEGLAAFSDTLPSSPMRFEFMGEPGFTRIIKPVSDCTMLVSAAVWM